MTNIKLSKSPKFVNLTGNKYNYLTVISYTENSRWLCKCVCGKEKIICGHHLKARRTQSCGCLHKENAAKINFLHGKSNTAENLAWKNIKQRCLNPKNKHYKNYGGRGITICDRWRDSFENFLEDMGERPSPKHSIDRIDNNQGYYKENCKWSTKSEQNSNKRNSNNAIYKDKRTTLVSLAKEYNIKKSTLNNRLHLGWSLEKAIETPVRKRTNHHLS